MAASSGVARELTTGVWCRAMKLASPCAFTAFG
jgi:hypothetical protein